MGCDESAATIDKDINANGTGLNKVIFSDSASAVTPRKIKVSDKAGGGGLGDVVEVDSSLNRIAASFSNFSAASTVILPVYL